MVMATAVAAAPAAVATAIAPVPAAPTAIGRAEAIAAAIARRVARAIARRRDVGRIADRRDAAIATAVARGVARRSVGWSAALVVAAQPAQGHQHHNRSLHFEPSQMTVDRGQRGAGNSRWKTPPSVGSAAGAGRASPPSHSFPSEYPVELPLIATLCSCTAKSNPCSRRKQPKLSKWWKDIGLE